ncbi:MAG TPA: lipoyl synthase [Myxococcota bacterium]|nr:lipoyl synthase [Myxococcota bacterium]
MSSELRAGQIVHVGHGVGAFVHRRLPPHCLRTPTRSPAVPALERLLRGLDLHTVCEEARCPNRGDCWARGHVTFMLLGAVCTRACRFCAVETGRPTGGPNPAEPTRVASAVAALGLHHVVLTSVNRDDLADGGAGHFAAVIRAIRLQRKTVTVEVLTPDFQGSLIAVEAVCAAEPDVYNHNVETVPRLYRRVRPGARFERSVAVLAHAKRQRTQAIVKSGLMVGLGETHEEVLEVLRALRDAGVDTVTIGQYLRPSRLHLAVERYWDPEEFDLLAEEGRALGFLHVASGPLIRSSYNAEETLQAARSRSMVHPSPVD